MAAQVELAQQQQAQPQLQVQDYRPALEDSFGRQVQILQTTCLNRHDENGKVIGRILGVASIVAGLYTAIVLGGGFGAAFLGFAAYLVLSKLFSEVYHGLRNSDFLDAAKALNARNFKEYILVNQLDMSIDSIVEIHQRYKQYLSAQIQNLPE